LVIFSKGWRDLSPFISGYLIASQNWRGVTNQPSKPLSLGTGMICKSSHGE
jgi:hypothetical protein